MGATRWMITRARAASQLGTAAGVGFGADALDRGTLRDGNAVVVAGDRAFDQLPEQLALGAEHGVHRLDGHAALIGYRLDRRSGVPAADEELGGRLEDRAASFAGFASRLVDE